ncbi:hypothetical protein L1987_13092 [Smallanthus sonchifolius]|uniref:Uncharacterized protein n=1 Tax=Smallanthus sonchifolius TaxID=185202 RepID=A0ACB9JHR8_9ASTR|nr:hypothetical protein L1987_13092 [Smallanthus sonchifolius]
MARYDMSGIRVNLREIPDENGEVKHGNCGLVLVSKITASASEIVSTLTTMYLIRGGKMSELVGAILVGERTYGKGLIQSVFELHDGSGVVVTVGKYVTPNHLDINGNGIDPDYKKSPGEAFIQLMEDELVLMVESKNLTLSYSSASSIEEELKRESNAESDNYSYENCERGSRAQ